MEKTPLLEKDSAKDPKGREQRRNLILNNVILCIMSCSTKTYQPVMSQYIYHRVAKETFGNNSAINNFSVLAPCFQNTSSEDYRLVEKAQEISATKFWQYYTAAAGVAVISNIFLGSYSDIVGRKFLFLLPMTGHLLRNILTTAIIYWHLDLDYFYMVTCLDALLGGESAFVVVCCAFAADNTPPEKSRTFQIILIECIMGLAESAAATATGYFIQDTGFFYPSLVSAALTVISLVLVMIFIKSASREASKGFVSPMKGLKNILEIFVLKGTCVKRSIFWVGLLVFFLSNLANAGGPNIGVLYLMNLPFCWGPVQIGIWSAISTLVRRIIGAGLVRLLQFCLSDQMLGVLGSLSVAVAEAFFSFSSKDWMVYLTYPGLAIIGFIATPVIRGILSRQVPSNRQGAIFSCMAVLDALCQGMGSPIYNNIYKSTVTAWRGAVFMVWGAQHAVGAILFCVIACLMAKQRRTLRFEVKVQAPEDQQANLRQGDGTSTPD